MTHGVLPSCHLTKGMESFTGADSDQKHPGHQALTYKLIQAPPSGCDDCTRKLKTKRYDKEKRA